MKKIYLPLTSEQKQELKTSEEVELSGWVYTLRDSSVRVLNKRRFFDFRDEVVYFCGPIIDNDKVISCGPTTTERLLSLISFSNFSPAGIIGKGKISPEKSSMLADNGVVYFVACGGAAVYLAKRIESWEIFALPELNSEAIFRFKLRDFPVVVAVDIQGRSIFK